MRKIFLGLSILIFINYIAVNKTAVNGLVLGLINKQTQIHEQVVPEYKEFIKKIRILFQTKNENQRQKLIEEIRNFGQKLISKLQEDLKDPNLTLGEKKIKKDVIYFIKDKLDKLIKYVTGEYNGKQK